MSTPQTINGLMRHLRNDCNIQIKGSYQKKQLISYGYYHGYKGYRFVQKATNRIPYVDFSEVAAVIEYDSALKACLYPELMFIETAIKNIVCNESIVGLKKDSFEYLYQERMKDRPTDTKLQTRRLRLRNTIYSRLSSRYVDEKERDSKMVKHFYDRGEDVPLWAIFELMYLSDLASFSGCLNKNVREKILVELDMLDISIDTNATLLSTTLYTIKNLRNAVAHNEIVFDVRFKDRVIAKNLKPWLEQETKIQNITLSSIIDYIIIICCLLKRIDFDHKRATRLLDSFIDATNKLNNQVNSNIYSMIVRPNEYAKLTALRSYLNS